MLLRYIVGYGTAIIEDVTHRCFYQPPQFVGHAHLRIVERWHEDSILVEHQVLAGYHIIKGLRDGVFIGLQQFLGRLHQLFALGVAMAVFRQLAQCIEDSAATAPGVILLVAKFLCYAVGSLETDAPDVICQTVGIILHLLDTVLAVLLVDLCSVGGTDTVSLQEHHDVLHILLFLPAIANLANPALADAGYFEQTVGIVLNNLEGIQPEVLHNQLGHLRPDALHQSAAQVLLYADDVCRKFLSPFLSRELPAITLVNVPVSLYGKDCTHRHLMEDADNGLFFPIALDGGLKDGIAILRILERDTLYGTLDLLHSSLFLTIILIRLPRLFNTIRFKAIFKETHLTVIPKW